MANNTMTSLDGTLFSAYLSKGLRLLIAGNSFSCDSSMSWVVTLNLNASTVITKPNPPCSHDRKANISVYCFMNFKDSTDNCPTGMFTLMLKSNNTG